METCKVSHFPFVYIVASTTIAALEIIFLRSALTLRLFFGELSRMLAAVRVGGSPASSANAAAFSNSGRRSSFIHRLTLDWLTLSSFASARVDGIDAFSIAAFTSSDGCIADSPKVFGVFCFVRR